MAKKQVKDEAPKVTEAPPLPSGLKRINIFKFGANWCGPCKEMEKSRILERFAEAHSDVGLFILNVDENEALADSYDVRSMPTVVFVDQRGDEFERITGIPTMPRLIKEYRECVKELKAEDAESSNEDEDEAEAE